MKEQWQNSKSKINRGDITGLLIFSIIFILIGFVAIVVLFLSEDGLSTQKNLVTAVISFVIVIVGLLLTIFGLRRIYHPIYVQHASDQDLLEIPRDAILHGNEVLQSSLSLELVKLDNDWTIRPSPSILKRDLLFINAFGSFMFILSFGLILFVLKKEVGLGWFISGVGAIAAPSLCLGTVLVGVKKSMLNDFQKPPVLVIPNDKQDIFLKFKDLNIASLSPFIVLSDAGFKEITLAKESIKAIQLCPRFRAESEGPQRYVQILLVFEDGDKYHRVPLLLTGDFVAAIRLSEKLSNVLKVPFLYHADDNGWAEEIACSRQRPKPKSPSIF